MRKVFSFLVVLPFIPLIAFIWATGTGAELFVDFLERRFDDLGWFQ